MISTACIQPATGSPFSAMARSSRRERWPTCWPRNIPGYGNISTASAHALLSASCTGVGLMETRANFVLIGIFTLAVIAAAFGFVLWFQNLHSTTQRTPLRIIFEGAASGLRNGGNVNFNGIRVGEVV